MLSWREGEGPVGQEANPSRARWFHRHCHRLHTDLSGFEAMEAEDNLPGFCSSQSYIPSRQNLPLLPEKDGAAIRGLKPCVREGDRAIRASNPTLPDELLTASLASQHPAGCDLQSVCPIPRSGPQRR
jgi:hypothetical protein